MTTGTIHYTANFDHEFFPNENNHDWNVQTIASKYVIYKEIDGIMVYIRGNGQIQLHWSDLDYVDFPELEYFVENTLSLPKGVELGTLETVIFKNSSLLEFTYEDAPPANDSGIITFELDSFTIHAIKQDNNTYLLSQVRSQIDSISNLRTIYETAAEKLGEEFTVSKFIG